MRFNPEHFQNVERPIFVTPSGRRISVKTGAAGKRTIRDGLHALRRGQEKSPAGNFIPAGLMRLLTNL
jgi:hypothetical protein